MMNAAGIVTQATQVAKCLGMTSQAGDILNNVLRELAQEYDMSLLVNTTTVYVDGSAPNFGTGPYLLPLNYLRACSRDLIYQIDGIPYRLIQITLQEYDELLQTNGIAAYPSNYATDVSPLGNNPPAQPYLYVYPPTTTPIYIQVRYYGLPTDIVNPATSPVIPWFPSSTYLIRRVAGELMALTGDPRADKFLGSGPQGCMDILTRYLGLQGDREDNSNQMLLDPRFFSAPGSGRFGPSKASGGV